MNVVFTDFSTKWAGNKIAASLMRNLNAIKNVAREFEGVKDKRTLVVILQCPGSCCNEPDPLLGMQDAVFVTPMLGISAQGLAIRRVESYPPCGETGSAKSDEAFLKEFRGVIEQALIN